MAQAENLERQKSSDERRHRNFNERTEQAGRWASALSEDGQCRQNRSGADQSRQRQAGQTAIFDHRQGVSFAVQHFTHRGDTTSTLGTAAGLAAQRFNRAGAIGNGFGELAFADAFTDTNYHGEKIRR